MQTPTIIVSRVDQLTVQWAQAVMDQHAFGARVQSVALLSSEVGTTTRVQLKVEHDGDHSLARHWFVKLPSQSRSVRWITALPRLLQTEIRYYQELQALVPVAQPAMVMGKHTVGWASTLVLSHLKEQNARPGNPGDELTVEQALNVVEQLAILHAEFWDSEQLNTDFRWLSGRVRRLEDLLGSILAVPLMKLGLNRAGDLVSEELQTQALRYAKNRRKTMRFLAAGPKTIVHHDCHPGNLFWDAQGLPGLLDWQMVRVGEGIGDVAYFLATALAPKVRRNHEMQLLDHYQHSLVANGVKTVTTKELFQRYQAHLTYPFEAMIISQAIGKMMTPENNRILIQRVAAAVEDHNAFSIGPNAKNVQYSGYFRNYFFK